MNHGTFIAASHPETDERTHTTTTEAAPAARKIFPCDEELRRRLAAFRDDSNGKFSNASIARKCGVNKAIVSQYLAEDGNLYPGDTQAQETLFREFLRDNWTFSDTGVTTIPTPVTEAIGFAIEDARRAHRLVVVLAEPGVGKTRGISLYVSEHKRAISFSAWEGQHTSTQIAHLLWDTAAVARGSATNRMDVLIDRLKDSDRVIIVDDAHNLSPSALRLLAQVRDRAGVGVVLAGVKPLEAKLYADAQLASRTEQVHRLSVTEPKKLVEHHLDQLLGDRVNGEREELLSLGVKIAQADGHFRSLQMDLTFARRTLKVKPDLEVIEAVKAAHRKMLRKTTLN